MPDENDWGLDLQKDKALEKLFRKIPPRAEVLHAKRTFQKIFAKWPDLRSSFKNLIDANLVSPELFAAMNRGQFEGIFMLLRLEPKKLKGLIDLGVLAQNTIQDVAGNFTLRMYIRTLPLEVWPYLQENNMWSSSEMNNGKWGFKVPDWEYTLNVMDMWFRRHRDDKADINEIHPLLWVFGAHEPETFDRYNNQIKECVTKGIINSDDMWEKQFEDLFRYFLLQSPTYQRLNKQKPISEKKRAENARNVNMLQAKNIGSSETPLSIRQLFGSREISDNLELVLSIRFREGHERMCRFAATLYAAACEWAINNRHARIYSKLGIVGRELSKGNNLADPVSVRDIAKSAEFHNVVLDEYRKLGFFGRLVFLTHSNASEMQYEHSPPIISQAVYRNELKILDDRDYTIMDVDHDKWDIGRDIKRPASGENRAGDIAGMIDEMLKAIVASEDLELRRVEKEAAKNRAK